MKAIHQLLAGFNNGDAISNEARVLRGIFRAWGYDSEIYCEARRILPALRGEIRDVTGCASDCGPDDVALLHLSIGSMVNDAFRTLPCRKAILYHNITPAHYLATVNPEIARNLAWGRDQMRALAGTASVNLACSRFNADELTACGYRDVGVFPLALDIALLRGEGDATLRRRFDDELVNVIFVGRCVPNKRIDDALRVFHVFHRHVEPRSRFLHVGSFAGAERYYFLLQAAAKELELSNVHFLGPLRQQELNAVYALADVFLCMSEHEGFCVPLIESMVHEIPVVAYAAGAVPDTLDGAGVLVREKRFELIAETIGRLVRDEALRAAVLRGQRERLARFTARDLQAELRAHLAPLLGELGRERGVRRQKTGDGGSG